MVDDELCCNTTVSSTTGCSSITTSWPDEELPLLPLLLLLDFIGSGSGSAHEIAYNKNRTNPIFIRNPEFERELKTISRVSMWYSRWVRIQSQLLREWTSSPFTLIPAKLMMLCLLRLPDDNYYRSIHPCDIYTWCKWDILRSGCVFVSSTFRDDIYTTLKRINIYKVSSFD